MTNHPPAAPEAVEEALSVADICATRPDAKYVPGCLTQREGRAFEVLAAEVRRLRAVNAELVSGLYEIGNIMEGHSFVIRAHNCLGWDCAVCRGHLLIAEVEDARKKALSSSTPRRSEGK